LPRLLQSPCCGSIYLRILAALPLLLHAGHPLTMTGQTAPQKPAASAQPTEAAELQHLLDQHQYIEYDDKLLATDSTHLTGSQNLYFSGMLAFPDPPESS